MEQLTKAQAMRELNSGNVEICLTVRYGKTITSGQKFFGWRKVKSVSPSGIVKIVDKEGNESQLDLPAASLMEYFKANDIKGARMLFVYDRGLRPMTPEENSIISKTESMEYWSQKMVLQKYGMDKLFSHNGTETFDYNTRMIRTPKVKGNKILTYVIKVHEE